MKLVFGDFVHWNDDRLTQSFWFECDEGCYPFKGFPDYLVAFISRWFRDWSANLESSSFMFWFELEPYWCSFDFLDDDVIVEFYKPSRKPNRVQFRTKVKIEECERMMFDAATDIVGICQKNGWQDRYLDELKENMARFRDYGSRTMCHDD